MRLDSEYSEKLSSKKKTNKNLQKKDKGNSILKIFLMALLTTIIVIYVGISIYFMSHFGFNTYINGELATGRTVKELQNDVISTSSEYLLKVTGRNGVVDYISSADVSLNPEFAGEFEEILKKQLPLLWPLGLISKSEYETDTVVGYSKDDLYSVIGNLAFFKAENIQEPKDAYVSENAGENGFEIVPETPGCKPIRETVCKEIGEAVDVLLSEVILSDDCYATAAVKSDDSLLKKEIDKYNEYCNAYIKYEFGNDEILVDGNQIREWLIVDGDSVTLDEASVREFVNGISKKYDTFGKTRSFKTHSGETIDIVGGDYGWWMDRVSETEGLIQAIKNHDSGVREPIYFATAAQYGDSDIGDTFVEIDLTKQHLWVYKEGQVVEESDFVSGNVNKGNGTPVGAYAITYKERDATLNGENYSSAVSYWMPFNGNVGMHDASWRSSFGEEIYLTNGSHGCINLPKDKAAAIYDIVEKREPVIVYGGKSAPLEEELDPNALTPEQQIALLIQAGLLNPDGSVPEGPAQDEISSEGQ